MRIAIASGKGGTGKTTVVTSLISIWPRKLVAVDMDVEEPKPSLIFKPHNIRRACVYIGSTSDR